MGYKYKLVLKTGGITVPGNYHECDDTVVHSGQWTLPVHGIYVILIEFLLHSIETGKDGQL